MIMSIEFTIVWYDVSYTNKKNWNIFQKLKIELVYANKQ